MTNEDVANKIYHQAEILASILRSKGISNVNANQGLAYLINKVSTIPQTGTPALTQVAFETDLTCNVQTNAVVGDTLNITGILTAFRDDISDANIDLNNGRLSNALIKIYNGNTLLGTTTTNTNGEYTYNYTVEKSDDLNIITIFDGNDDYTECENTMNNITVLNIGEISVSADKNIINKYDNEYCTITAQLLDNNNNTLSAQSIPIQFKVISQSDGSVIESITENTDARGIAIFQYYGQEKGEYTIQAEYDNFVETINLSIVAIYYDDCTGAYSSLWTTNPNYTTLDGYNVIKNDKGLGNLPTNEANVLIEFDLKPTRSWGGLDFGDQSENYCFFRNAGQTTNDHSAKISPKLSEKWYSAKINIENGIVSIYLDNSLQGTYTDANVITPLRFFGGSSSYPCYLKNIKITEL